MFFFLLAWVASIFAATYVSEIRGNGRGAGFLLGFFLGPIGLIIAAVLPANQAEINRRLVLSGDLKRCPSCAEFVQAAAQRCRYCQEALQPLPPPANPLLPRGAPAGPSGYELFMDHVYTPASTWLRNTASTPAGRKKLAIIALMWALIIAAFCTIYAYKQGYRLNTPEQMMQMLGL